MQFRQRVTILVNRNLAGRCGFYCGVCEIYRAYKDSEKLREKVAKKHGCSPDDVKCEGCQAVDICGWSHDKQWGANCKILECLNSKGLKFCFECDKYDTCELFSSFAEICLKSGIDLRKNLQMIKEGKIEQWLLEQDKKWRCPNCGKPVIVSPDYKTCHWCGYQLHE